jgi:hypothetical protein
MFAIIKNREARFYFFFARLRASPWLCGIALAHRSAAAIHRILRAMPQQRRY